MQQLLHLYYISKQETIQESEKRVQQKSKKISANSILSFCNVSLQSCFDPIKVFQKVFWLTNLYTFSTVPCEIALQMFVGSSCWDSIFEVPAFPQEDSDVRATEYRCTPGGNATNSAIVFAQLAEFAGRGDVSTSLASILSQPAYDRESGSLLHFLNSRRIDTTGCVFLPPPAVVSHSAIVLAPGSRTIVHHRSASLREWECQHEVLRSIRVGMAAMTQDACLNIHFEGRAVRAVALSLRHMRMHGLPGCPSPVLSVELEKMRPPETPLSDVGCCDEVRSSAASAVAAREGATTSAESSCAHAAGAAPHAAAPVAEEARKLTMWDLAPFAHILFVSKPFALATLAQATSSAASAGSAAPPHGEAGDTAGGKILPKNTASSVAAGAAAAASATASDAALAAVEAAADAALHRALPTLSEEQLTAHTEGLHKQVLVMPWGELGAFLSVRDGAGRVRAHVPAHAPASGAVVDTLGAGDTFNAAFVFAATHPQEKLSGRTMGGTLGQLLSKPSAGVTSTELLSTARFCAQTACFVAGEKTGQHGLLLPPTVRECFSPS